MYVDGNYIYFKSNERDKLIKGTHFYAYEFACGAYARYGKIDNCKVYIPLIYLLEKLRKLFGNHPLTITDGFRTDWYNNDLIERGYPAASNSQHLYGKAADIRAPRGITPYEMYKIACEIIGNDGGVGLYDWGIHVDLRGKKARWNYSKKYKQKRMGVSKMIEKEPKKKKKTWLSDKGSGKKLSAILWICTFGIAIVPYALYMFLNFILLGNEYSQIDSNVLTTWSELMGVWITGLIWFSGFITFGKAAKRFFENNSIFKDISDIALDKIKNYLSKKKDNYEGPIELGGDDGPSDDDFLNKGTKITMHNKYME